MHNAGRSLSMALGAVLAVICTSGRDSSDGGEPTARYFRVAEVASAVATAAPQTLQRAYMLRRAEFEVSPTLRGGTLGPNPDCPNSAGRIVEVVVANPLADGTKSILWRFAYPMAEAFPRPVRAETLSWDHDETALWAFVATGDVDPRNPTKIEAFRVNTSVGVASGEPELADRLSEWPATISSEFKFEVANPGRLTSWAGNHMRAIPDENGFLVSLYGPTSALVRWIRFTPKGNRWKLVAISEAEGGDR
jgi:hypothetical protein